MVKTAIDTNLEKLIITSLIVSDKFCKSIIQLLDIQLLKVNSSKLIAKWCIDYFKKYKKAPHKDIQNLYNEWLNEQHNEDDENLIKLFLEHLSSNYERENNFNEEYAIDQAIKYLKQRKLKLLKLQIDELTANGQNEEAEKLVIEYKKIQLPITNYIDVFSDIKVVDEVLNWEEEELFTFGGELGKAIGNLTRGDLIAFAAPAKRGKSFLLIETAIRATILGLRTLFFSLEMPKNQVLSRIYQNILGETKKEKEIEIPRFKEVNNLFEVEMIKYKKQGLQSQSVKNKIRNLKMILKGGKLKLFCNSPHNISVTEISEISDNLVSQENFVADLIIIDFADIVKSDYKVGEHRHKLNNVWEQLRALALQKHCLIVTATHTNKMTFDRDMKQGDMSEDIRKINHVSLMLGINQKKEEKKKGIARLMVLANRQDEFFIDDEIVILQCLNIGKSLLDSKMKKFVNSGILDK